MSLNSDDGFSSPSNNKRTVEYFVAAVLWVYLAKAENLAVGQFPAQLGGKGC